MSLRPLLFSLVFREVREMLLNPLYVVQYRLMVKDTGRMTNPAKEARCLLKLLRKLGKKKTDKGKFQNALSRGFAANTFRFLIESGIEVITLFF